MRALLVSGLGPTYKNRHYLRGTLFDRDAEHRLQHEYFAGFGLSQLQFDYAGKIYPLLRPRRTSIPHLTTFTLEAILESCGCDYDVLRTERVWAGEQVSLSRDVDVVLVSTTYTWDRRTLARLLDYVGEICPDTPIILGGQYSNLKHAQIMIERSDVHAIVRGDGEQAIPALIRALARDESLAAVPNLVYRERGLVRSTAFGTIDLDYYPSPQLSGNWPVIPYESMRGCPFSCKFCSFPAASPTWRYKSARKIHADWVRYAEQNGAAFIKAMDSTFTVPKARLRELLALLPGSGVEWEGYSRANIIRDPELLDQLAAAHCRFLSIGFESMSPRTLEFMNKQVRAEENRRAFTLLADGPIGYRCSFMGGYPGETPDDYRLTHEFLAHEYAGHFMLSVFSLQDEQMPVWADAERFQIRLLDPDNPDYAWTHCGMDVATAEALTHSTLDTVRSKNERAVLMLWQADYQHWLLPHRTPRENLAIEKAVERIAMLPRDQPDAQLGRLRLREQLGLLERYGVRTGLCQQSGDESLLEI